MKIHSIREIANGSDHDALVAAFIIGGVELVIASWNAGDHGTKADLHHLCDMADIVLLQEVGDWNLGKALPDSWGFRTKDRVAVAWDKSRPPVRTDTQPLHKRVWGGPGAGPDKVNPKSIVYGVWKIGDHMVSIGAIHLVASQQHRLRWLIARREVAGIFRWFNAAHDRVILGGDWNTQSNSRVMRRLVAHMKVSQHIATHGNRAIDFFLYGRS